MKRQDWLKGGWKLRGGSAWKTRSVYNTDGDIMSFIYEI